MTDVENPFAFPQDTSADGAGPWGGMTLRDWFAGGVASALSSACDSSGMWTGPTDETEGRIIAEKAYMVADAMLVERAKAVQHD
jgi:hypothetical protein